MNNNNNNYKTLLDEYKSLSKSLNDIFKTCDSDISKLLIKKGIVIK